MLRCGDAALQTVKLFGEVCGGVALPKIATVARPTTGKAIPNSRRPRLLTKVVEYQSLTLISSSFGLNNVSARYHQNLVIPRARWLERFPPPLTGGQLPGDRGNGSGGDAAVLRSYSPADANDARCRLCIVLFDSNSRSRLCISFRPISDFSGRRPSLL